MTGEMLVGLIGYPLRHSISPVFQQAAFDLLGIEARYELWETPVELVSGVVLGLRRQNYLGANVTIPYKQMVSAFLDEVDENARLVGAVNTIVRNGGRLCGFNTDVFGFAESLRRDVQFSVEGSRAVVLGAGGAARGVVAALILGGAKRVTVFARRLDQAEALSAFFSKYDSATAVETGWLATENGKLASTVGAANLVVNTTPIGTAHRDDAGACPIDPRLLAAESLICDLVYNPPETAFLRAARERGLRTLNGLPMLVYQGAAAFSLWTGREAPVDRMRSIALEALGV